MLRILQQFILTALFAVFASQASAMFISPDPMDPTKPGVGTNRYAYSLNDPINRMDPSGYDSVWSNGDGTWSSSDGSTYDPSNPENNTYDLGSDQYGYTVTPGYSPPELPGVQTSGNIPNVPSSGRTTVITVTSRDYNNPGGPDISRSALHDRTSVFDTGINSYAHQELEREVYNAAGGPSYVGPRMLAIGVGSVAAPIAATESSIAIGAGANYVRKNTSIDGPSAGLAYGNGRIFGVRWNKRTNVFRLDYQPYPGTNGQSRLHFHLRNQSIHYPLDPRRWFD